MSHALCVAAMTDKDACCRDGVLALCTACLETYFECNKSDQAQTVADIFKQSAGTTPGEKFDSFIHTIGDVLTGQELE